MSNLILCWTTVAFCADADKIATALLDENLAACIQVDGPMRSHYRWKGEQLCDEEHRLWIKSTRSRWESLRDRLKELHPYDEPQIVMTPIDAVEGYARWVEAECD
ncbi:MAG: divalent-cation tolerance protein CutA [Planctomycetota bacterium]